MQIIDPVVQRPPAEGIEAERESAGSPGRRDCSFHGGLAGEGEAGEGIGKK